MSTKEDLLRVKWELGAMNKFKLAEGEAPYYSVSVREAGVMPVRVIAKLDFGYGKKTDEAVAQHIVETHNQSQRLQREHHFMLGFLKEISTSPYPQFSLPAQKLINEIEKMD